MSATPETGGGNLLNEASFALFGGIGADLQQQSINANTCTLYDQMTQYKEAMNNVIEADTEILLNYYSQVSDMNFQIADLQDQITQDQVQFKQTYYQYVTLSIIFIVLVIFSLLCKKVIFKGPQK